MMSQDELDQLIEELAVKISKKYKYFGETIYEGIINNKVEIRVWLKKNKTKVSRILKTL